MIIEIKIPSPGESITEVELASWMVKDGDLVTKDQEIAEVESDKATLPLIAAQSGKLKILVSAGNTIAVGTIACTIDTSVAVSTKVANNSSETKTNSSPSDLDEKNSKSVVKTEVKAEEKKIENKKPVELKSEIITASTKDTLVKFTPLAKKLMDENGLTVEDIVNGLKKITTHEVEKVLNHRNSILSDTKIKTTSRSDKHEKLTSLRRKLSERLVKVKNETAMLTTFNEVDMSKVMALRQKYQKQFVEKHGIKLGFMSFFTKAASEALLAFPKVNSMMEGEEIITPEYTDIAIAVQTDKGLMVPVLRNTEAMSLADIEKKIIELAQKARSFRLSIEEMTGGTFTITNGGIFGSMLSTPIINPPQSAILGMHNIVERPIAVDGKVEIRPIMYLALSYDHRLIDGRDSVSFLVRVKELIESPEKMLFAGLDPEKLLLEL